VVAVVAVVAVGAQGVNGLLVTRIKLPPFIVTLGTFSIFTAVTLIYAQGQTVALAPGQMPPPRREPQREPHHRIQPHHHQHPLRHMQRPDRQRLRTEQQKRPPPPNSPPPTARHPSNRPEPTAQKPCVDDLRAPYRGVVLCLQSRMGAWWTTRSRAPREASRSSVRR
jgi:hypothetical protein